jgi:hypothetical protein
MMSRMTWLTTHKARLEPARAGYEQLQLKVSPAQRAGFQPNYFYERAGLD